MAVMATAAMVAAMIDLNIDIDNINITYSLLIVKYLIFNIEYKY